MRNLQRGFSLLELLVAFVIMSFSLAMLYQASGGTVRNLDETEKYQRAALLAQSLLNSRDGVMRAGWNESGRAGSFDWKVSTAPFSTGFNDSRAVPLHELQVVIAWSSNRGARELVVRTLLPQIDGPAGGTAP